MPQALAHRVHDCFHLPDTTGSDHCPVGVVLALPLVIHCIGCLSVSLTVFLRACRS